MILSFLQKLLVFSSDQRISAGKALLHPYFRYDTIILPPTYFSFTYFLKFSVNLVLPPSPCRPPPTLHLRAPLTPLVAIPCPRPRIRVLRSRTPRCRQTTCPSTPPCPPRPTSLPPSAAMRPPATPWGTSVETLPIPLVDQKIFLLWSTVNIILDTHVVLQCALKKGTEYLAREALKAPKRTLLIGRVTN